MSAITIEPSPVLPTAVTAPVDSSAASPAVIAPSPTLTFRPAATPAPAAQIRPAGTASAVDGPFRRAAASSPLDFISELLAPVQGLVEGIGLLIKRTFFNEAPVVNPVQTSGQAIGPITGTVGAVDPEDDPISYRVTVSPANGTVSVGADGSYTYTPGSGFTGLDSFTVEAADEGLHINLLDLFRPAATAAYIQVAQNPGQSMVTFAFVYGSGAQFWSQTAKNALQSSALALASYLVVTSPVTITYKVTASNSRFSSTLASAGSDLSGTGAGFFTTVVQQKLLTGVDTNGATADGTIDWNFGPSWGYGSTVSSGDYDFTSTAMHELLHTFGFISYIDPDPQYSGNTEWTSYDRFVVTAGNVPVINPSTFQWNGTSSALFFNGANAVAIYGGLVPLYSPSPYEAGSSVSHLRDSSFTGANSKLMISRVSTGTGLRILSPLELAMLKDLGYNVSNTPIVAFLLIGFRRIRRRAKNG